MRPEGRLAACSALRGQLGEMVLEERETIHPKQANGGRAIGRKPTDLLKLRQLADNGWAQPVLALALDGPVHHTGVHLYSAHSTMESAGRLSARQPS